MVFFFESICSGSHSRKKKNNFKTGIITKVKENERKASGFSTIVQVPPFVLFMENEDFNWMKMVDNLIVAITNWRRKKFLQHSENHSIDVYLKSPFRNAIHTIPMVQCESSIWTDDFVTFTPISLSLFASLREDI